MRVLSCILVSRLQFRTFDISAYLEFSAWCLGFTANTLAVAVIQVEPVPPLEPLG